MTQHFDVIIIGSGPNGLATAAYLSKAGQRVLLLEKRYEAGGGLATEQVTIPEFYHNTHAIYKMMVDYAPVYSDFEMEKRHGVEHIFPEVQVAMPLADGRSLCVYQDVDKTCKSIAQFSAKDAESYRDMHHRFDEMMKHILGPQTYVPMEGALEMAVKAEQTELGRELSEYAERTPEEIVCDLFEDEQVRTFMLYMACHWGLDYEQTGVSYMVPIYLNRMSNYRLTAGGSHRVSNALLKSVFEQGGQIRTCAQIARILVEGGEARGVVLEDGSQILADKAVVSTIDIHKTFFDYVGEDKLESEFVNMLRTWEWEEWSLCNVHLALAEPPHFKAAESQPDVDRAFIYLLGYESLDDLRGHWDAMREGRIPAGAGCNGCFPSVHDSYQAPPGRATGLLSQMAPFELADGGSERWLNYSMREEVVQRQVALLQRFAPNLAGDKVLWTYLTTPADIENKFANMVKGSYKQGAYQPLQMGYLRPNQDCSHYRTPIGKLYLGGASVAPGGMVIFGPGYNCANAIADDYGIEKWWKEPEYVTAAREKNYI
ncbi:MAG: NAD(P)/FAD-dependent oxidoreductase [Deltaproteobacteria bacterium]|nr:NAD(P)/FAD-dependent oxidoreductase [Deltaproteobacteria bacterium]